MAFTDAQIRMLSGKLNEKFVKTRAERGLTLSYVEAWHVIDEANRVFGFEGWDRETVWAECVWADGRRDPKSCSYAVRVRIRVRAGEGIVSRDGSGVGHGTGATLGEAHESALKEAETDATKRALTTFGNLFGLALYDKAQNGVRRSPKPNGTRLAWVLVSAAGDLLGKYDTPQRFCAGMREAIEGAGTLEALDILWMRNTAVIDQLRTVCPDLRTSQGFHYADILERLYRDRHTRASRAAGGARTPARRRQVRAGLRRPQTPARREASPVRGHPSLPRLRPHPKPGAPPPLRPAPVHGQQGQRRIYRAPLRHPPPRPARRRRRGAVVAGARHRRQGRGRAAVAPEPRREPGDARRAPAPHRQRSVKVQSLPSHAWSGRGIGDGNP